MADGVYEVYGALGSPYSLGTPFGYQAKRLSALRRAYRDLPDEARARVDGALGGGPGADILAA